MVGLYLAQEVRCQRAPNMDLRILAGLARGHDHLRPMDSHAGYLSPVSLVYRLVERLPLVLAYDHEPRSKVTESSFAVDVLFVVRQGAEFGEQHLLDIVWVQGNFLQLVLLLVFQLLLALNFLLLPEAVEVNVK